MLLLAFQPFLHALSVSLLCIFSKNKKGFQHRVHQIWVVVPDLMSIPQQFYLDNGLTSKPMLCPVLINICGVSSAMCS